MDGSSHLHPHVHVIKPLFQDAADQMALRYYTSKLRSFEELEAIRTLGFRGEGKARVVPDVFTSHLPFTTVAKLVGHLFSISRICLISVAKRHWP